VNLLLIVVVAATVASYALGAAQLLLFSVKAAGDARAARVDAVADRQAKLVLARELAAAEQAVVQAGAPYGPLGVLAPMGPTDLCDPSAPCGLAATATFAIDGQTDGAQAATAQVVAPNVESVAGIWERRVAVTMTVTVIEAASGNVVHARPQRVKVRLWAPDNAEVDEGQDAAARWNRVAAGAAENEGCASDGSGCDQTRVQAADPTTIDGRTQCVLGAGSGTCGPSESKPDEHKTSITWSNPQASSSAAAP
jgi:hypothetical protein